MQHLGDITKISGYQVPITDCVIGGSPCQDLSVAGKRAGLDGERSGLFMEQIRIIKEMRDNDRRTRGVSAESVRPRYMVWENVPGAFSSNKGEDFRIVLEETAKIADKNANVPRPSDGKWKNAGCIIGNGYSIAWRVVDAQYFVPQRRRRITLVADFNGHSAPYIVFEEGEHIGDAEQSDSDASLGHTGTQPGQEIQSVIKGLPWYSESCGEERKGSSADAEGSSFADNCKRGCSWDGGQISPTLTANNAGGGQRMPDKENFKCVLQLVSYIDGCGGNMEKAFEYEDKMNTVVCIEHNDRDGRFTECVDKSPTLKASMGTCGNNQPLVVQTFRKQGHPRNAEEGQGWEETDKSDTLNIFDNSENRTPIVVVESVHSTLKQREREREKIYSGTMGSHMRIYEGKTSPICARDYKDPPYVVIRNHLSQDTKKE